MDFHMTPTAELAHIVLPAATFLERIDLHVMRQIFEPEKPAGFIALGHKAVDEVGECWPDWKFWFELAKRTGYAEFFPWSKLEEAIDYQLQPTGIKVDDLRGKTGCYYGEPVHYREYLREGFNTPTGKVEIYSTTLKNLGFDPLPSNEPVGSEEQDADFPLTLITGSRSIAYHHSGDHELPSVRRVVPEPKVRIHPLTAKRFSVRDGREVMLHTRTGSIVMKAEVTQKIIPETVSIPHGWVDANANLLVSCETFDPIFGAPRMKSVPCRITPI
jgi:anaerobic selenocysteine-containing dehydrogenase